MANALKEFPLVSAGVTVLGAIADGALFLRSELLEKVIEPLAIPLMFGSPFISGAMAVPAVIDLCSKERSGLSKIFSAAAAGIGIIGAVAPSLASGDGGLGNLIFSILGMTGAGALNVISYLTRNTNVSMKVDVSKNSSPPAPPL